MADRPCSTQNPEQSVLSLRGISKNFGAVSALTDIDLDVHAGEVVGLVGDNGAGKSTLVKVLAGVHRPTAGTVRFGGKEVTLDTPPRRSTSALRRSFRTWRCARTSTSSPTSSSAARATPWRLDEVGMEVRAWTLLNELSARIPIGPRTCGLAVGRPAPDRRHRALAAAQPKLIMLDEPTAALGVAQTAEVLNLIERVRDRGLGVIMISHNMEDVRAVADRIVVLRLGRNNGIFLPDASNQELVAAITGATENAVSRRLSRTAGHGEELSR
jgi:D-xylose transport system ATP-binding protein